MQHLKIQEMALESLIPYVNNPRDNKAAVDKVAGSIAEFGFKVPLVIDKNNIIVTGHTRYLAAKKLGLETVPVIIADDLTEAQVKAFRIADNKVSEYATWDEYLLRLELEGLEELGVTLNCTGFEDLELESLLNLGDVPDDLDLGGEDQSKTDLKALKFCGNNVPMTDEEAAKLSTIYDQYTTEKGTNFGFVGFLLERR